MLSRMAKNEGSEPAVKKEVKLLKPRFEKIVLMKAKVVLENKAFYRETIYKELFGLSRQSFVEYTSKNLASLVERVDEIGPLAELFSIQTDNSRHLRLIAMIDLLAAQLMNYYFFKEYLVGKITGRAVRFKKGIPTIGHNTNNPEERYANATAGKVVVETEANISLLAASIMLGKIKEIFNPIIKKEWKGSLKNLQSLIDLFYPQLKVENEPCQDIDSNFEEKIRKMKRTLLTGEGFTYMLASTKSLYAIELHRNAPGDSLIEMCILNYRFGASESRKEALPLAKEGTERDPIIRTLLGLHAYEKLFKK